MRRTFVYPLVLCLAGLSALSGCSWFDSGDKSRFQAALERVASSTDARTRIMFSDTAAIVKLTGKDWGQEKGFAALRATGAEPLAPYGPQLADETGIGVLNADFIVSAGAGQKAVGLVAGGQNSDQVSGALTKLGWRNDGGRLVGPEIASVGGTTAGQYALVLAQVRADGADVVYGQRNASLDSIGKPSGKTVAEDERIDALADCLGDVVAAEIDGERGGSNTQPAAVAVGVRRPDGSGDTPRGVVCLAWNSSAAADRYAGQASTALNTGKASDGRPFADQFKQAKVSKVGGDHNIVRWEADTPTDVLAVFQILARSDIPGLPR